MARSNRAITKVNNAIGVHATMDNNVIKSSIVESMKSHQDQASIRFQQFIIAMGIRVELGAMIRP
jgi:hypothetical protein